MFLVFLLLLKTTCSRYFVLRVVLMYSFNLKVFFLLVFSKFLGFGLFQFFVLSIFFTCWVCLQLLLWTFINVCWSLIVCSYYCMFTFYSRAWKCLLEVRLLKWCMWAIWCGTLNVLSFFLGWSHFSGNTFSPWRPGCQHFGSPMGIIDCRGLVPNNSYIYLIAALSTLLLLKTVIHFP